MKLQVFLHSSSLFMAAAVMSLTLLCDSAVAVEPVKTGNPAAAGDGVAVGRSKRDGITVTGNEAFITRHGVTEKLIKELELPTGVIARPDGTMILPDKTDATLRATQLLTLEGKVVDVPLDPAVNNPPTPPQSNAAGGLSNGQSGAMNRAAVGGSTNGSPISDRGGNGGGGAVGVGGGGAGTVDNVLSATFVTPDGRQFTGTINPDGSITTTDGRSMVNDGSLRVLSVDANGNQVPGPLNRNGTATRADGSTISPDGTVRSSDGRVISTRESRRNGMPANGSNSSANATSNGGLNNNAGTTDTNNPQSQQVNGFRVPGGNREASGNSPNNTGTVNTDNMRTSTSSPNNTGTLNNGAAKGQDRDATTNSPNNAGTTNVGNASRNNGAQSNSGTLNNQTAPNAPSNPGSAASGTQDGGFSAQGGSSANGGGNGAANRNTRGTNSTTGGSNTQSNGSGAATPAGGLGAGGATR